MDVMEVAGGEERARKGSRKGGRAEKRREEERDDDRGDEEKGARRAISWDRRGD